ncbi:hypothetical protein KM043_016067 [Ampulex compressa]|nr:hypothetical protein KM043_016067 [Ampulex compressa]
MAPAAGREAKNKGKGEENTMKKYVKGGEVWSRGLKKILMEIDTIKRDMKEEIRAMKEEMEKRNDRWKEERKLREEEMQNERERWKIEKAEWAHKMMDMEWRIERREKVERKNNIVIKGVTWKAEGLGLAVEEFIMENLAKGSIVIAELNGWESKKVIMRKKRELSRGIFIEDDLTKKKMEMQRRLGKIAKKEREKGDKNVKVGYRKIYMGERWYWWDERREKLEEERRGRD